MQFLSFCPLKCSLSPPKVDADAATVQAQYCFEWYEFHFMPPLQIFVHTKLIIKGTTAILTKSMKLITDRGHISHSNMVQEEEGRAPFILATPFNVTAAYSIHINI